MKPVWIGIGVIVIVLLSYVFLRPAAAPVTPTPTGGNPAKIDINAVCEGALAYMSFPNGAAAQVWVEECKQGRHPEAIEQWKVQMGITDGKAI